jgi:hypothetical protein
MFEIFRADNGKKIEIRQQSHRTAMAQATPALFYTPAKELQLTSEFYGHFLSLKISREKNNLRNPAKT